MQLNAAVTYKVSNKFSVVICHSGPRWSRVQILYHTFFNYIIIKYLHISRHSYILSNNISSEGREGHNDVNKSDKLFLYRYSPIAQSEERLHGEQWSRVRILVGDRFFTHQSIVLVRSSLCN